MIPRHEEYHLKEAQSRSWGHWTDFLDSLLSISSFEEQHAANSKMHREIISVIVCMQCTATKTEKIQVLLHWLAGPSHISTCRHLLWTSRLGPGSLGSGPDVT